MKKIRTIFLIGLAVSLASAYVLQVLAAPPESPYNPGATLDPNCAPGDPNCTVTAPEAAITASTTTAYWRGDKSWQTLDISVRSALSGTSPITYSTSTGAISFDYNTTNLQLTSNQLNTIQDIATSSSPTFAGLLINGNATTTGALGAGAITGTSLSVSTSTLGNVISGVWLGTAIGNTYIASSTYWNAKQDAITLASSTSGTDFSITNSNPTWTFNLPSATSTVRGLLTAADWTSFNSKLSSYTETDPVYSANSYAVGMNQLVATSSSPSFAGLTLGSLSGILTASSGVVATTTNNSANWDTAYIYRLLSATSTSPLTLTLASNALTGSILQASGSQAGYLSSDDWTTFNSKELAITASTTTAYWRGDKSWQTLNQAVVAGLTTADSPTFAGLSLGSGNLTTVGTGTFGSILGGGIDLTGDPNPWTFGNEPYKFVFDPAKGNVRMGFSDDWGTQTDGLTFSFGGNITNDAFATFAAGYQISIAATSGYSGTIGDEITIGANSYNSMAFGDELAISANSARTHLLGYTISSTGQWNNAIGHQLTLNNIDGKVMSLGYNFTNTTTASIGLGVDGLDLLITAGSANFQDTNILTIGTLGARAITGTSFTIGANTLDTNEWAYLDGQDQAVKTTSDVIHNSLSTTYLLGDEKLTNGTFTGDATGWTLGTGWTYNTNLVRKDVDGTGTLSQTSAGMVTPLVVGEFYTLTFTLSSCTVGMMTPSVGGVTLPSLFTFSSGFNGTYSITFKALSTADLAFTPTNTSRFYIDTISLKKEDGNVQVGNLTGYSSYNSSYLTYPLVMNNAQKILESSGSGLLYTPSTGSLNVGGSIYASGMYTGPDGFQNSDYDSSLYNLSVTGKLTAPFTDPDILVMSPITPQKASNMIAYVPIEKRGITIFTDGDKLFGIKGNNYYEIPMIYAGKLSMPNIPLPETQTSYYYDNFDGEIKTISETIKTTPYKLPKGEIVDKLTGKIVDKDTPLQTPPASLSEQVDLNPTAAATITSAATARTILPETDNVYSLGAVGSRWANLYVATTTVGDLVFGNEFRITEDYKSPQALIFKNQNGEEIMRLDESGNLTISGEISSQISNPKSTSSSVSIFDSILDWLKDKILQAKEFIAEKITTKELCVEDVCINKAQLKELLEKNQITTDVVPPTPNTPPTPDVCDATHLNLCSTQADCETVSGHWYNESCNTEPETSGGGSPPITDTTPPVITLVGDSVININVGDAYVDAGATASDDVDGDISAGITMVNSVDTNVAGTYTVTYNVSDAAGNAATEAIRTVKVEAAASQPEVVTGTAELAPAPAE